MSILRYLLIGLELVVLVAVVLLCIPGLAVGGVFGEIAKSAMRRGEWLIEVCERDGI